MSRDLVAFSQVRGTVASPDPGGGRWSRSPSGGDIRGRPFRARDRIFPQRRHLPGPPRPVGRPAGVVLPSVRDSHRLVGQRARPLVAGAEGQVSSLRGADLSPLPHRRAPHRSPVRGPGVGAGSALGGAGNVRARRDGARPGRHRARRARAPAGGLAHRHGHRRSRCSARRRSPTGAGGTWAACSSGSAWQGAWVWRGRGRRVGAQPPCRCWTLLPAGAVLGWVGPTGAAVGVAGTAVVLVGSWVVLRERGGQGDSRRNVWIAGAGLLGAGAAVIGAFVAGGSIGL